MTECQRIERTIMKTYRQSVWQPFVGALKQYELVLEGDRVAVCVSGGKDSVLLAKCMQMLHRYTEVPFELCFLCIDPGYSPEDRRQLEDIAQALELPLIIEEVPLFRVVSEQTTGSPCYLCARMRRGWLYKLAQKHGCNKIALGHHLDDMVETAVMSMLYGAEVKTMLPKLRAAHYDGMELIRPLYGVEEHAVKRWAANSGIRFLHSGCPLSEHGCGGSKRQEAKELMAALCKTVPQAKQQLFRSMHNVNIGMVPGYRLSDGEDTVSFLSRYGEVTEDA